MSRAISLLVLLTLHAHVYAQEQKQKPKRPIPEIKRFFQVALFPGISTNGINSGSYQNTISLNFFGGLSAGNKFLEIGTISNVNLKKATGIQLAGLANVTGANAFVKLTLVETRSRYVNKEEVESNFQGIQVAGMMNYVRDHAGGIQLAGLLNVVGGDLKGIQVAGIGNSSGNNTLTHSEGFQLAGLYNISKRSMAGFQVSSLFNYTDGGLSGMQLGLINKAYMMYGKHTMPPTRAKSLQLGLLNFSREMDGIQFGLFNFGGAALGTQIGLINFFSRYPSKEDVKKGMPIGILNFGSKGSVFRASLNDLFPITIEYTTGNCWNCSANLSELPFHENNTIYNQNPLLAGYNPLYKTWGFGWGVERIFYNKHSMLPVDKLNNICMMSYGIRFLRMNRENKLDKEFNLVGRLHAEYGKRFKRHYVFIGGALNYFLHDPEVSVNDYHINSTVFSAGNLFGNKAEFWPGYTLGIQW
ncbi:hypothetical protein WSM22_13050 [Cytophagales bacterium WSM2-2]|nr:hypothetical protein WSM22_13050 [Cytophagales bacterium WSM2-2]